MRIDALSDDDGTSKTGTILDKEAIRYGATRYGFVRRPILYILDGANNPVSLPDRSIEEWSRRKVSTIFLGVDAAAFGPPELYETMIFGGRHDRRIRRYSTFFEAKLGHARALRLVLVELLLAIPRRVVVWFLR